MALDQAFAKSLQDFIHGAAPAPTLAAGRKVKLVTQTTPSASAANTEIATGGGYPAGGVAATFSAATAALPSVSASVAFSITNMPAVPTIGGVEITDNAGTPVRLEVGGLTGGAKSTNAGDTLSFATSAIASALS